MLKLNTSRLALAVIFALSLLLVAGVISTQARDSRQEAPALLTSSGPVQTAPRPVGTYPAPVPSYPAPVPSYGRTIPGSPTAKPAREARRTVTPEPWQRYVEVVTTQPKQ